MTTGTEPPTGSGRVDPVKTSKAILRRRMLARRAGLSALDRTAASARINARLAGLPELADAEAILGYAAFGTEVDIDSYLGARIAEGKGIFLPWVDSAQLRIARITDLEYELAPGFAGLREPHPDHRRPARPDRLDAAVVPGVAFDRRCARLGYGGGYFDKLLAEVAPSTIVVGVAYEVQLVDTLPSEPHDRGVDVIITDAGIVRP